MKSSWRTGLALRLPKGDKISLELVRESATSRLTVLEAWELYEPYTKRENRSWQTDVGMAKPLTRIIGTKRISSLTLEDIEMYRNARFNETTKRRKKPTPTTINHEVALLRRIINHAVRMAHIKSNPLTGLKLLKENNIRYQVISESQFRQLVDAADTDIKPILILAYDTGMRKGELLGLKWSQVNLKDGTIFLTETKTDYPRMIYLTERALKELKRLTKSTSGYVFVNPTTNKPWCDIKKKWKRACEGSGLTDVWFHDLRRSFVTNARKRGVPESVVMRMTGHRTREIFERYNVISDDDVRGAVFAIEAGRMVDLEDDDEIAA